MGVAMARPISTPSAPGDESANTNSGENGNGTTSIHITDKDAKRKRGEAVVAEPSQIDKGASSNALHVSSKSISSVNTASSHTNKQSADNVFVSIREGVEVLAPPPRPPLLKRATDNFKPSAYHRNSLSTPMESPRRQSEQIGLAFPSGLSSHERSFEDSHTISSTTSSRHSSELKDRADDMFQREMQRKMMVSNGLYSRQIQNMSRQSSSCTLSTIGALPVISNSTQRHSMSGGSQSDIAKIAKQEELLFEKELLKRLTMRVFKKGEVIVNEGDIGLEMMFIRSGSVNICDRTFQTTYAVLSEGSFFGEIGVLFPMRRTASVCANSHCVINILRKDSLDQLLYQFPSIYTKFRKVASIRLEDIQRKNQEMSNKPTVREDGEDESCPYPLPGTQPTDESCPYPLPKKESTPVAVA